MVFENFRFQNPIFRFLATLPEEIERLDVLETLEKSVAQIEKALNSQNLKKRISVLKSKNEEVKQSLESFTISVSIKIVFFGLKSDKFISNK